MSNQGEEAIVKPKPLRGFSRKNIIYTPFETPSRILQKTLKKIALKEINIGFGYLYLLKDSTVLYQSISAPLAVLSLETLIASGAKRIILLGFCGSLNPEYKMMNVVSISKAYSDEGTSRHYFPRKKIFYPSPFLKKSIESTLHRSKLPFISGSLVSTDAPYRETKAWLKNKQKKAIDFVDMEASAVFALANFRRIHAAALMIVSDELSSGVWKEGFHSPELEEKIKKYFTLFLKHQFFLRYTQ